MNKIEKSLFVEAREWHDKTYGNSYFSARVWIDGEIAFTLPFQYGYGSHYESVAQQELVSQGYLPADSRGALSYTARQLGIDYYATKSVVNKREMFKAVA